MVAGTVALVVGFLILLAWDVYGIRRDLEAGRDSLDALTLEAASSTGLTGLAQEAAGNLNSAASRARSSLPLKALSLVPGLDDQIDGIRRMADATAALGTAGAEAAQRIDVQMEEAGEPAGRLALLDTASEELDRLEATLEDIDLGSASGLVGPLRRAHDDLTDSIEDAKEKLDDGRRIIAPVRAMLQGPSTFLLLVANNAEMAGGSGLALSAGGLTFNGGDFQLADVVRAGSLRLPASLPVPENIRQIYRPTGVGIDMRSTTRSPDLTTMGPLALSILEQFGLPRADGVIVVDAVALRDLMALTGGVTVDGVEIDAENVLEEVLHNSYLTFETSEERDERVSYQGEIAKKVFETITESDVPTIDLAKSLLDASQGRHLVLWASEPDLQDVFEEFDVSGALDPLGLMVSFQNYNASKLDWYLHPHSDLEVRLLPSGDYRARLTMSLPIPEKSEMGDVSPYILGSDPEAHAVFLTVHLPEAAYDITTPDPKGFRTAGEEPPMQVRTFLGEVALGETYEEVVEFSLPREVGAMILLPSARVEPMTLTVDGVTVDDRVPSLVSWLVAAPPSPGDGSASPWARLPALCGLLATIVAAGGLAFAMWRRRTAPATDVPVFVAPAATLALALFALAALIALVLVWSGNRL